MAASISIHADGGTDPVTKRQSPTPAVESIHILSLLVLTYTCGRHNLVLRAERATCTHVSYTNRCHKSNVHTDSKTGLTTSWLAQNLSATSAKNDRLGMRKHSRDGEASRAFDVHEERVRALDQTLELVAPLLLLARRIDKINCESLRCQLISSSTYHSLHSRELGEKSQMWRHSPLPS